MTVVDSGEMTAEMKDQKRVATMVDDLGVMRVAKTVV